MNKLYNYLEKSGDAIAVGLGMLCIVIFIIGIITGFSSSGYDMSTDLTTIEDKSEINFFNSGLVITIALGVLCVILMFVGIFWDLFRNFKTGSKFLIGFGVLIVVFFILYSTSSHDSGGRFDAYWSKDPFYITESLSKFISAGLYSLVAMSALAFLSIVVFEIRNFFK
jgi:hypothetical protein